jgi:hypothetical protein
MKLFLVTAAVATALAFPAIAETGGDGSGQAQMAQPSTGLKANDAGVKANAGTKPSAKDPKASNSTKDPLNDTTGRGSGSEGSSSGGGDAGGAGSGSGAGGGGSGGSSSSGR